MADPMVTSDGVENEAKEDADKSEWEGIIMEAIATMIYVFVCCGVVTSTANVTFDELNSRLIVISLAREWSLYLFSPPHPTPTPPPPNHLLYTS